MTTNSAKLNAGFLVVGDDGVNGVLSSPFWSNTVMSRASTLYANAVLFSDGGSILKNSTNLILDGNGDLSFGGTMGITSGSLRDLNIKSSGSNNINISPGSTGFINLNNPVVANNNITMGATGALSVNNITFANT